MSLAPFQRIKRMAQRGCVGVLFGFLLAMQENTMAAPLPPDIAWKSNLHSNFVNGVAISPDGTLLASASGDTTIKLWRLSDGTVLRTLTAHSDIVNSVAFSPDGTLLASGSGDTTVKLWRVTDGTLVRTLTGHSEFVSSVAFSPDGTTVASGSGDTDLRLWRVSDGTLLRIFSGHISVVWSIDFSPDGTMLASGSGSFFDPPGAGENNVKLWRVSDAAALHTLTGHSADVWSVKFSPDGTLVASGSGDKTIKLWSVSDGALQRTLTGHSSQVLCVAFAPDGLSLASGSHSPDNTLKFWRVADGAVLKSYNQETYFINSIAFAPDGLLFGYGRDDNYVVVARNPYPPAGPPRITIQPLGQTVLPGASASFVVQAIGSTPLSSQWRFNGENISAATNSSLTITSVVLTNDGDYMVMITNASGSITSAPAHLAVLPGPRISGYAFQTDFGFRLQFSGPSGASYSVLATTNLSLPSSNWTLLGSPVPIGGGIYQFTDPDATNHPARSYQLRWP